MVKINKQIKLGFYFNYLNIAIGFAVTLLLTPLTIRVLGKVEYGLFGLIGSIVGYLHLLEFGIGDTIVRYVAKFTAEHQDEIKVKRFVGLIFILYCAVALFLLLIGTVLFFSLDRIFGKSITTPEQLISAQTMLVILVITSAIGLFGTIFSSTLAGLGQIAIPRISATISWAFRIVLTILVIFYFKTSVALTLTSAIGIIASSMFSIAYCTLKMHVVPVFHNCEWYMLKELFLFSLYNFAATAMGQLYWKLGTLLAGMFLGSACVTYYDIGIQLSTFTLLITNSFPGMFLPYATTMAVHNASVKETTSFMSKIGRFTTTLYAGITIGFIFLGKKFICLWVGPEYEIAYWITLIALVGSFICRIQSGANLILRAKNLHGFLNICYLIAGLFNVLLSLIFMKLFGVIGLSLSTAIALFLGNVLVANWYYHKKCGIDVFQFFYDVFHDKLIPYTLSAIAGFALLFLKNDSWPVFLLQGFVFASIYFSASYFFGTTAEEKDLLKSFLKKRHSEINKV